MATNNDNFLSFGSAPVFEKDVVFVDVADPNTAEAVFEPFAPQDSDKLYVGPDGSTWVWNGTAYVNDEGTVDITKVGDSARLYQSTPGLATISNTVVDVIRMDKTLYQHGSTVIAVPSAFAFRLKAGYRYRVEAALYGNGSGTTAATKIGFYTATIGAYAFASNSPATFVVPASFSANNGTQAHNITMEINCTVDTAVRVYTMGNGAGTLGQASDGSSYITAVNIGVL